MNYQKHYDILITRARTRILEGYTERHHILPKCMGGTDHLANLVELTPEEHYVAHQLLVKIYPDEGKLTYAVKRMCTGHQQNKLYGWLKKRHSAAHSAALKAKGIKPPSRKGTKVSDTTNYSLARKKTWAARIEDGTHLEIAQKTKATREENGSYTFTQEHKDNISKGGKGRVPWNKGKINKIGNI